MVWLGLLLWGLAALGGAHAQEATPPPSPAATIELLPTETRFAEPEGYPAPATGEPGSETTNDAAAPLATATLIPSPAVNETDSAVTPAVSESLSERLIERALPLAIVLFVLGFATLIVVLAHLLRTRVR